MKKKELITFIKHALNEDIGEGDHSSIASIPINTKNKAHLLIKNKGIIAGVEMANLIFKEVDASLYNTKTFGNQVEDTANIVLTNFKNQRINIHLNFWQKNSERLCVVYGTQGTMKIDIIKRKIYINNNKKRIINFRSKFQESYKKQIKNFVSSIKNKKRTRIDIKDSIESLKIIEKIRLSNKLNKRVRI